MQTPTLRPGSAAPAVVTATVDALVARAAALAGLGRRYVLGVVGAPGAGKSTVCQALDDALGDASVLVPMDGFHLADEVLVALGRRERKGAPDTFDAAGYAALLDRLRDPVHPADPVVYAPRFDRGLEAAVAGAIPVPAGVPLVITEGNYLLHDADGWGAVRDRLDEVWFLDVDPAERERRLVARRLSHGHPEDAARAWVRDVDLANGEAVVARREAADLVVTLVP